ncbi:GTPase MTG2, mitochondrial [Cercospora beticola]|uniref:GTPase MTG2, mitochondrial n=1 Tax=Cercospora beticola TaxID=122368 RepID=A0A2G5IE24_CERBT|nr:GTPase MTG2, mitochondrial [Cercospora beticola]PIB03107.1 GTPase MTG2, mitochondrial [Cercospora beticola]WPB04082.1 hypothetical protein RHO25_008726 [Cercospora beticola]CAK1357125.1 unnamed protein product [Cercospora beticola]
MSISISSAPRLLFLYPCLDAAWNLAATKSLRRTRLPRQRLHRYSTAASPTAQPIAELDAGPPVSATTVDVHQYDHLDPVPLDYSSAPFTDACTLSVAAGTGGHGCISFLREKYIANGPPNGGDGGFGGSVYIQAVQGETSLHKLARRGLLKAGRGKNGQGSLKGGARGEDILITVPVGTVVREISRNDPMEAVEAEEAREEHQRRSRPRRQAKDQDEDAEIPEQEAENPEVQPDKWLLYPGGLPKHFTADDLPPLPRPRRSPLAAIQPPKPLRLDLDQPMDTPLLLAAGAVGGLGNPHFVSKTVFKPKYATKGQDGIRINLQLELKLLADIGLVGLPNAGKSTLMRAITRSRTRVGNWAFTTLAPNIGTLVLDNNVGRPVLDTKGRRKAPRERFTIADIPGLIEDAHLDKGLGLGFLRHIERAAVLAFVVDLNAGDAVEAVKALWREIGEYEKLRERELNAENERVKAQEAAAVAYEPFGSSISPGFDPEPSEQADDSTLLDPTAGRHLPPLSLPPISSKPWLVVATKADLPGTQENFQSLQGYLRRVESGEEAHPSDKRNAWRKSLYSVPVSAINKQGVGTLPEILLRLLDE